MSARRAGKVMLGAEALSVNKRDGVVEVETSAGVIRGRTSLVTTPLPHAAKILEGGTSAAYAQSLNRIRYLGNVCLVLEMTRSLSELYWLNVNDPSFPVCGDHRAHQFRAARILRWDATSSTCRNTFRCLTPCTR
jgi:hypothetical protein